MEGLLDYGGIVRRLWGGLLDYGGIVFQVFNF